MPPGHFDPEAFIDRFCVQHQYWLFQHHCAHILLPRSRPWMLWRLIMFFFHLKAGMGEIDLHHNRRVKRGTCSSVRAVWCHVQPGEKLYCFLPFQPICFQKYLCQSSNSCMKLLQYIYSITAALKCTSLSSSIINALKHFVHNSMQLSLLYGIIHLCLRLFKLEPRSDVKSRAWAALFVVLPSARVRLHARLSTKLGNCPVTADKHLLVQIILSRSRRELLSYNKHLD